MAEKPTREQAEAFVDALTGYDAINEDGDPCGRPNSPGAFAHLRSVLCFGMVPTLYTVASPLPNSKERVARFVSYLRGVADALIPPEPAPQPEPVREPEPAHEPAGVDLALAKLKEVTGTNYCSVVLEITDSMGEKKTEWNVYTSEDGFHKSDSFDGALSSLKAAREKKAAALDELVPDGPSETPATPATEVQPTPEKADVPVEDSQVPF